MYWLMVWMKCYDFFPCSHHMFVCSYSLSVCDFLALLCQKGEKYIALYCIALMEKYCIAYIYLFILTTLLWWWWYNLTLLLAIVFSHFQMIFQEKSLLSSLSICTQWQLEFDIIKVKNGEIVRDKGSNIKIKLWRVL